MTTIDETGMVVV